MYALYLQVGEVWALSLYAVQRQASGRASVVPVPQLPLGALSAYAAGTAARGSQPCCSSVDPELDALVGQHFVKRQV